MGKQRGKRSKDHAKGSTCPKQTVQYLSGCLPAWHFSFQHSVTLQFYSLFFILGVGCLQCEMSQMSRCLNVGFSTNSLLGLVWNLWAIALLFAHQAKKWELLMPTQFKRLWWVFHSSTVEVRSLDKDTEYLAPGTLSTAPPDLLCPEVCGCHSHHIKGWFGGSAHLFPQILPFPHICLCSCDAVESRATAIAHSPSCMRVLHTSVLHCHVLSGCTGCLLDRTDVQRTWLWL